MLSMAAFREDYVYVVLRIRAIGGAALTNEEPRFAGCLFRQTWAIYCRNSSRPVISPLLRCKRRFPLYVDTQSGVNYQLNVHGVDRGVSIDVGYQSSYVDTQGCVDDQLNVYGIDRIVAVNVGRSRRDQFI